MYGPDATAFFEGGGMRLVNASSDLFVADYQDARIQAEQDFVRNAKGDYRPSPAAGCSRNWPSKSTRWRRSTSTQRRRHCHVYHAVHLF
jgi:hypothetical protein